MKKITVAVDDDTWRRSSAQAARLGASLSTLLRGYLTELADQAPGYAEDRARSELSERNRRRDIVNRVLTDFDARGVGLRMSDNLPRDALYDRDAPR